MKTIALALAALILAGLPVHAQTRSVIDDAGRTVAIPEKPQRIVAMHEALIALPLLELGLDVSGVYGRADDGSATFDVDFLRSVLGDDPKFQVPGIGPVGNIDLEKLRAMKPDLIIGMGQQSPQTETLETIAPVYLQATMAGQESGFSIEQDLASLLGRTDVFEEKRKAYSARVEEVRKALPEDPEGKTYLAVIVFDQISAVRDVSGAIQAVRDLGYAPYDWSNRVTAGAASSRGFAVPLSSEAFARLDPDVLIVMNSYMSADQSEDATRARLDAIAPGWSRFMRAAKEGKVVFLNSAITATPTIASASHTLDAIEAWAKR